MHLHALTYFCGNYYVGKRGEINNSNRHARMLVIKEKGSKKYSKTQKSRWTISALDRLRHKK